MSQITTAQLESEIAKRKKEKMATNNRLPQTAEEWFAAAPVEIQGAVRNAMEIERREKAELIEQLTANSSGENLKRITERLMESPLGELRDLVSLLPNKKPSVNPPSYFGASVPQTANQMSEEDKNDFLPLPTINWKEKQA